MPPRPRRVYDAISSGTVQVARLRSALAALPLGLGRRAVRLGVM